jgi:hypothetical protein
MAVHWRGRAVKTLAQWGVTWTPAVAGCLVIQASLLGFGVAVDRWLNPEPPCCTQPLVL